MNPESFLSNFQGSYHRGCSFCKLKGDNLIGIDIEISLKMNFKWLIL